MIVPLERNNNQNEKSWRRLKEHKNNINSTRIAKYGSKRLEKIKMKAREYWDPKRLGDKTHNRRNISSTNNPSLEKEHYTKDAYYYKNINNNNNIDTNNQVSYSSAHEDELDGLEALEDPKENSGRNTNQNGFPFGSKASSFQSQCAVAHWFLLISCCIIMCM